MAVGLYAKLPLRSLSLGGSRTAHCQYCHSEDTISSMTVASLNPWKVANENQNSISVHHKRISDNCSIRFRCKNPIYLGSAYHLMSTVHKMFLSRVWVAADYSDSLPESSNYSSGIGYHPLEELKEYKPKDKMLTNAEMARTAVQANNKGLLVFPGMVHCEPHGYASWGEYQYVVDDYGDIYFEIYDDENIMQDREDSNPVNLLIGLDEPKYKYNKSFNDDEYESLDIDTDDGIKYEENDHEVDDEMNVPGSSTEWGYPDTMHWVHPIYFAKHLTKAIHNNHRERMDHPSNGIVMCGFLRPALLDEEYYFRKYIYSEESDGHYSDWKDESDKEVDQVTSTYDLIDGDVMRLNVKDNESRLSSTLYKLEITSIQLFSIYGNQCMINLEDFQEAEPDILVHSASTIIGHFNDYEMKCNVALKTLCRKKKGLTVEGASIIGVDSLGLDVRVYCGTETKTLRFSFNAPATSESAAEKKIRRMLFPRHHRKNMKPSNDAYRDDSF